MTNTAARMTSEFHVDHNRDGFCDNCGMQLFEVDASVVDTLFRFIKLVFSFMSR